MTPMYRVVTVTGTLAGLVLIAGCGGSSGSYGSGPSAANPAGTPTSAAAAPGSMFRTGQVSGLGTVLVDGRGRTVYVLSSGSRHNLPCEDSTGCTKAWPDVPLPAGLSAPAAGPGAHAALLGSKKANGETYPTYNGWLLYEFAGDSGPGDGNGDGIHSFGGTWHALSAAGSLTGQSTPATASPTKGSYQY